jgi:hypothetical protein
MDDNSGVTATRQRVVEWCGTGTEIIDEFPVLRRGWELDDTGYVVRKPDGAHGVVLTNHGQPFEATEADLSPLIASYEEAARRARAAAGVLAPTEESA